jgi:hypothetical protein
VEGKVVANSKATYSNFSLFTLLFSGVYLQFSGRLFAAELLFFVTFLGLVVRGLLRETLISSKIVLAVNFLLLALCGQLISDLYRKSEIQSTTKGFLRIFFTIINLIVISRIVNNKLNRYLVVVVLYAISCMASYLLQPQIFEDANPWKFGFGYPVTAIFFAVLTYKVQIKPQTILTLSFLLAAADFLFGARNLALVTVLASLMSFLSRRNNIRNMRQNTSEDFIKNVQSQHMRSALGIIAIVVTAGTLVFFGYKYTVTNGYLGTEAKNKFNQQSSTNTNLLFTSRSEVFSQYIAIRNSPIIGHGSYATLTEDFRQKLLPWLIENRLQTNLIQLESGIRYLIPVHSGLFGLWVWFGILVVPFFIFTLNLAVTAVRSRRSSPIVYYYAFLMCWDIFFSPFGMYARMQYPISIIGMLLFSEPKKKDFYDKNVK